MPRRYKPPKRKIPPDSRYNNEKVAKFINIVLRKGKKTLATRIVYKSFDIIKERTKEDPINIFNKAIENVRPQLLVKPRRIGGATYQVPFDVPEEQGIRIAMRWIVSSCKAQKGKPMEEKLATELINATKNTGPSIKRKEDAYKMAIANRAFAHYRW